MANPFTSKQANYGAAIAPGEWEMQQPQILRQRKLAEALQQQADEPLQGQMVSGIYVAPSWTQGAAKLAKALSGRYQLQQADEQEKALSRQMRETQAAELGQFMELMQGKPATAGTAADTPEDAGGYMPGMPAQPGDPNAALRFGMQSSNPMLQQVSMQQMLAGLKPKDNPFGKVDPKDFTAESVAKFAASGNYADLVPARKMELSPTNQVWNPWEAKPGTVMPDPNKPFSVGANGPVPNLPYQQYEVSKAKAGASKTNNTMINAGPKAFEVETAKLDAKELDEMRTGAKAARDSLALVGNMREAVKKGVYSGGGADAKKTAASYVAGLTGITPKALAGSEEFDAEASKLILERIKTLGANPSNADREFIAKTVPQLTTSPAARDQLINYIESRAKQTITDYEDADAYARKNQSLGGWKRKGATSENPDEPPPGAVRRKGK